MEAALWKIWLALKALFLAPGKAMLTGLASTPWGSDWLKGGGADWPLAVIFAVFFWCILFSLLGAMDDRVGGFLRRNNRRDRRRND